MAVTKILARHARLDLAINYAVNPDKTDEEVLTAYLNCDKGHACHQMLATKEAKNNRDGVQYYHIIQSFKPGEITPELALKIAQAFAKEHLADYEVVIGVHVDKEHIHAHMIFNSVNQVTGRKYHSNAKSYYQQIRTISDKLCREHGLSVIMEGKPSKAVSYIEWLRQSKGQPTFRSMLEADLRDAIADANDLGHFFLLMEHKGYEVNYVSNFTDVDDKIIKKAVEEGVDANVISERYIAECKKDMASLNVRPATTHPQATQEICGMEEMIRTLIEKGYAYAAEDGTVYYRVRSFKDYGKLSHKNLDDLEGGKRSLLVSGADQKEDPLDFVLWKPKKEGEPFWKSPWCDGRPGWHIECSVMSKKYLGDEIDIHAGGEDLIFPHHENEIAQSEAANGKPFAHYWMHNAFLNIDNHKMSKSAGNFFTVRDIVAKYDPMVLRFFMLSAHYRSPLNFSAELMEAAANSLERIRTAVATLQFKAQNAEDSELTEQEKELLAQAAGFEAKFDQAMDDDFNTADAIAAIFELVKFANTCGDAEHTKAFWEALKEKITTLSDVCGLIVEKKEELLDADVEALIEERQAARKAKNFARADEIRQQLLDMGIVLEDTREGVKWKRA